MESLTSLVQLFCSTETARVVQKSLKVIDLINGGEGMRATELQPNEDAYFLEGEVQCVCFSRS